MTSHGPTPPERGTYYHRRWATRPPPFLYPQSGPRTRLLDPHHFCTQNQDREPAYSTPTISEPTIRSENPLTRPPPFLYPQSGARTRFSSEAASHSRTHGARRWESTKGIVNCKYVRINKLSFPFSVCTWKSI
ncbi:hypothetical protein AVEN_171804-1 [Araneus ventricosus]|uniref:Uncharacterized protein n=1 Tax=Araneus ventricosus TaxID=182803 RepID=A0A4Y2K0R3_ARAVE|nr:hypothetical protein AVEN_171804-1 [Araneus ventricosus]